MASRRPDPVPPHRPAARKGAGGARPTGRRPRRRKVLGWVLGLVVAGVVLAVGGFAAAYAFVQVPDPNKLADAQTSTVYFSDGTTELGTFAARNRENVTLDQVPDHVQKAVLAAEDRGFYENRGVSPTGIARAVWTNLSDGTTQGGSTLTQQYVKNYYLSDQQSYSRKAKEFFIALKIDQQQSKDETLQNYLNTVYFGRGAWGIQAAAQAYFGVDAAQLDVSQGALLAALLKGPSNYDPRKGPQQTEAATVRVGYVLDGMVSEGWLSPDERAAAGLPETVEPTPDNQWRGPNGFLLKTVEDELTGKVGLSEDDVEAGGLRIVTTFDAKAQAAAVQAVQDQLPSKLPEGFHAALSAIDPRTGGVTAMYGGADYLANQFNDVTQARAQPGSTFKPFALVAALEDGISLRTTFNGSSPQSVDGNPFSNFGREQFGRIDLVTATEHSVNTVYAQLNDRVTPAKTRDVAVAAGYPEDDKTGTAGPQYIANVLGTSSPHPIDVTQAYATFAAQGQRTAWHTIASIDDSTGTRTYTASPTTQQAFPSDVAADATYAMEQVVNSGTGAYAKRLNRPAAGKTGTTNDNLAAWFAGYTPDLAATVALFQTTPDGTKNVSLDLGGREVTGGSYPVRIWTSFMRAALEGTPKTDFPDRANVGSSRGSSSSSSSGSSSTSSSRPAPSRTSTGTATQTPTDSPTGDPTDDPADDPADGPTDGASDGASDGPTATPTGTPSRSPGGATGTPTSGAAAPGRSTATSRPGATATGAADARSQGQGTGQDRGGASAPAPATTLADEG
ncbi:transglycosylase domain-containing protein [Kineococcus sp. LSe6-4]|uniref:Transglycosylase domain-containing protein n=1 Tax=Kineococcus halophytocola TaxID=3234027 RepID=A0ABV4H1T2_9ACTN